MITGAAGFIGGVLTRKCVDDGLKVLGLGFDGQEPAHTGGDFEICDVRDAARMRNLIASFRPDRVFHLAAQSYPTVSLEQPLETMETNAGGTINVFEGVRSAGINPPVVVACSSAEYGPVAAADLPVKEEHPLRPLHPYGVSKVAQDLLTHQYFLNYGLHGIRIRIFNTTGAGKLGDVCSDLTKRATQIEAGLIPPRLKVGNLTSRRAIIDARDLVRGLWLASERCQAGEVYNVGASTIYSVSELLERIRAKLTVPFEIEQERSLMRDQDELVIAGDTRKFQAVTGWSQVIDLGDTLNEMIGWWRTRFKEENARYTG